MPVNEVGTSEAGTSEVVIYADMSSEEDSVPLTSCNGHKIWVTSELMLQLTTPTAAAQVPCCFT